MFVKFSVYFTVFFLGSILPSTVIVIAAVGLVDCQLFQTFFVGSILIEIVAVVVRIVKGRPVVKKGMPKAKKRKLGHQAQCRQSSKEKNRRGKKRGALKRSPS